MGDDLPTILRFSYTSGRTTVGGIHAAVPAPFLPSLQIIIWVEVLLLVSDHGRTSFQLSLMEVFVYTRPIGQRWFHKFSSC